MLFMHVWFPLKFVEFMLLFKYENTSLSPLYNWNLSCKNTLIVGCTFEEKKYIYFPPVFFYVRILPFLLLTLKTVRFMLF